MGDNFNLLKNAIKERKKIIYKYNDEVVREGFPYVLFYNDSNSKNSGKIFLTIYKCNTGNGEWRSGIDIEKMFDIKILDVFLDEIHEGYNPNSSLYSGGILERI